MKNRLIWCIGLPVLLICSVEGMARITDVSQLRIQIEAVQAADQQINQLIKSNKILTSVIAQQLLFEKGEAQCAPTSTHFQ